MHRHVLEALGDYKCDAGMSVQNVPAVGNIKTLKGQFIAHKFSKREDYGVHNYWVLLAVVKE
jgi:hypothetical protein